MPSVQRGQVVKLAGCWSARWRDENGNRLRQGGFVTKSEARAWLDNKVEEVLTAQRGGEHDPDVDGADAVRHRGCEAGRARRLERTSPPTG
jgi:hypothetical protein